VSPTRQSPARFGSLPAYARTYVRASTGASLQIERALTGDFAPLAHAEEQAQAQQSSTKQAQEEEGRHPRRGPPDQSPPPRLNLFDSARREARKRLPK
jgi:hypothetical protein